MKILITGKRTYGVAGALNKLYPGSTFISRNETGHDLCERKVQDEIAEIALDHDVFINCSALWRFNQTLLLQAVFKRCHEERHAIHIINIGSTVERVTKGRVSNYAHDKEALKNQSHEYSLSTVWNPNMITRSTYISFGTMPTPNAIEQHPDRKKISLSEVAGYIKWIIDQPVHLHIHEISIDPRQQ
jgi:NADP-dependent 3-hydroxy acid dehydrogenase YdfG